MRAAIESFERAVDLEPEYALARAGLANSLAWFSVRYAYQKDATDWGRRAEEEAPGHWRSITAWPKRTRDRQPRGRLRTVQLGAAAVGGGRSMRLDPPRPRLRLTGARPVPSGAVRPRKAAASRAIALNPEGNVETQRLLVAVSLFSGRFEEAAKGAEELVGRTDAPVVRLYLGQAMFYLGRQGQAAELLASLKRGTEPDVRSQAALAAVLAATGQPDAAQEIVNRSSAAPRSITTSRTASAPRSRSSAARGSRQWLRSAVDDGFPCYPWFAADPLLEPVRQDPAYKQLMQELRDRFEAARSRYAPPA